MAGGLILSRIPEKSGTKLYGEQKAKYVCFQPMDEGRKRVIGIMASILASLHMQTANDLFGTPQGSPRTDKLIEASIQWAERIMVRIDERSNRG